MTIPADASKVERIIAEAIDDPSLNFDAPEMRAWKTAILIEDRLADAGFYIAERNTDE